MKRNIKPQNYSPVILLSSLFIGLLLTGCTPDEEPTANPLDEQLTQILQQASNGEGLSYFQLPESTDFDAIPQDERNPLSPEKIALGKLLFHETGLAQDPNQEAGRNTYSCASCHFAEAGFQAGLQQGIGEGGTGFGIKGEGRSVDPMYASIIHLDVQAIRSPSAMNTAFQEVMLWSGMFGAKGINTGTEQQWQIEAPSEVNLLGYEGVESQAIRAMEVHGLELTLDFVDTTSYKALYDLAFPDFPEEERYTAETTGLAIAAYERILLANQAPFQEWLKGNVDAMDDQQKRGALLFFDKAQCNSCHTGPALNSMAFYGLGMYDLFDCPLPTFKTIEEAPENLGRGGFTQNPAENYQFKVPQLYNLIDSPFYGHGSSFTSVEDVLRYKNAGIPENPDVPVENLAPQFKPLGLTDTEMADLTAFLEKSLYDPNLSRYEPESLPSGFCFPNNDPVSKVDLDCN